MAGNSTFSIQNLVDDASTFGDLAPVLATGGFSDSPALSISNDTITAMLDGGPDDSPFNWKWNRLNVPAFPTISFQQDYFVPGVVSLGWLESCWTVNINQTSILKAKYQVEVKKDLEVTFGQTGYPGKICWLPNDILQAGTWGTAPLGPTAGKPSGDTVSIGINLSGQQNPGPGVIYTNPVGIPNQPINATTNLKDANGNLWTVTTYGTCGNTLPSFPSSPVFPTYQSPTTTATTVTDGSTIWTAINPKGQGFRLSPLPPQTGIVWVTQPVCQMRIPIFKTLGQTIEPVPDDYMSYFKQGFFAQCMRRSPDPKVRAKFKDEWAIWLKSLKSAVSHGNKEQDDFGFYPGSTLLDSSWSSFSVPRPDYPFWP